MTTIRYADVPFSKGRLAEPGARNPYPAGTHDAARWDAGFKQRKPVKSKQSGDDNPSHVGFRAGIIRGPGYYWTEAEKQFLKDHFGSKSLGDIAVALPNRSIGAINEKAEQMGLTKKNGVPEWTQEDTRDLRRYINLGLSIEGIAERLGREPAELARQANKIGINLKSRKSVKRHGGTRSAAAE